MNKMELVNEISVKTGASVNASKKFLEAFLEVVTDELKSGEKVQITGFGTFEAVKTSAREGRNPQTGELITIAEKIQPKFKAGKNFKDSLN